MFFFINDKDVDGLHNSHFLEVDVNSSMLGDRNLQGFAKWQHQQLLQKLKTCVTLLVYIRLISEPESSSARELMHPPINTTM